MHNIHAAAIHTNRLMEHLLYAPTTCVVAHYMRESNPYAEDNAKISIDTKQRTIKFTIPDNNGKRSFDSIKITTRNGITIATIFSTYDEFIRGYGTIELTQKLSANFILTYLLRKKDLKK